MTLANKVTKLWWQRGNPRQYDDESGTPILGNTIQTTTIAMYSQNKNPSKRMVKKTEKNGTKFSQIVLIRLSLTAFTQFCWTLPLQCRGVAKVERPQLFVNLDTTSYQLCKPGSCRSIFFQFFWHLLSFTNGQLKEQYQQRGAFLGVETQHLIYGDNGAAAEVDKK